MRWPLHVRVTLFSAVTLQQSARAYSVIPPPRDSEEKEMMHRMLRVDHAGEYGANRIYAGQMAVLGRSRTGPLIQVSAASVGVTEKNRTTALTRDLCKI